MNGLEDPAPWPGKDRGVGKWALGARTGRASGGAAGRDLTWPVPRRNSTESSCSGTPPPPPPPPIAMARVLRSSRRGLRATENNDFRCPGPLGAEEYGGLRASRVSVRCLRMVAVLHRWSRWFFFSVFSQFFDFTFSYICRMIMPG